MILQCTNHLPISLSLSVFVFFFYRKLIFDQIYTPLTHSLLHVIGIIIVICCRCITALLLQILLLLQLLLFLLLIEHLLPQNQILLLLLLLLITIIILLILEVLVVLLWLVLQLLLLLLLGLGLKLFLSGRGVCPNNNLLGGRGSLVVLCEIIILIIGSTTLVVVIALSVICLIMIERGSVAVICTKSEVVEHLVMLGLLATVWVVGVVHIRSHVVGIVDWAIVRGTAHDLRRRLKTVRIVMLGVSCLRGCHQVVSTTIDVVSVHYLGTVGCCICLLFDHILIAWNHSITICWNNLLIVLTLLHIFQLRARYHLLRLILLEWLLLQRLRLSLLISHVCVRIRIVVINRVVFIRRLITMLLIQSLKLRLPPIRLVVLRMTLHAVSTSDPIRTTATSAMVIASKGWLGHWRST